MKKLNSAVVLVLTVSALFFAGANQCAAGPSEQWRSNGLLRIKHSPVLGLNIPINIWIDGRQEGSFTKGHVFERSLTPGRHMVYARRPGVLYTSFYGPLDVRSGETLSFVVKSTPNQVYLLPTGRID